MKQRTTLQVQRREARGKWAARRLRAQGLVPAVVYGHGEPTVAIQVPARQLHTLVRHGERLLELTGDGESETTFIRDIQWDPFGIEILHVDFERVRADERIEVEVPIELRGTAPGVEQGGTLSQALHHVAIECLATEIPESIRVDIRGLQLGQSIHVGDLEPPPGVRFVTEPEVVVVHLAEPVGEEAAEAAEAEPGAAEPELVGRRVAGEGDQQQQREQ